MPIIVSCPSCSGQLRVADDLIGRKVRCPACSTTFDAEAPPPPAPMNKPAESQEVDAWKFLDLELKADPSPPPRRMLELDGDDIPLAPRDPSPPPQRDEPPPRARLEEDHDDLFPCKVCGRMCHNDARRCSHCGERFDQGDEDFPRRRRPRRLDRRDTEPHRAGFVLAMGIVSLVLLLVCWPLSIVFGLIAWICGRADLRKMREETMDPEGESSTQAGWICGIIGTCLSAVVWLGCGTFIGMIWYEQIAASKRMAPQRMNVPPQPINMPPINPPPPGPGNPPPKF